MAAKYSTFYFKLYQNSFCVRRRTYFKYSPELSQPQKKEPTWTTPEEAVKCIQSGMTVITGWSVATPIKLCQAMTEHGKSAGLKDIHILQFFTVGELPYLDEDCKGIFHTTTMFVSPNIRKKVKDGTADSIPIFMNDIPKLFFSGQVKPDVAMIQVSTPDEHGYCTLGTNVDFTRAALLHSKIIVGQVNKHMPRTFGESLIHISHLDFAVSLDADLIPTGLFTAPLKEGEPEAAISKLIGENLVEDEATIQTGVGKIPDGILKALVNHKDLGVHTEMFSDGVMDLVNQGVITNHKKTLSKGRITTSFFHGSSEFYKFCNNNPLIEMRTSEYVNNPYIISQQTKMTAINACIEVDLTGQVVSESIGTTIYSGFGGQLDFVQGAANGFDGKGKAIIATNSIDRNTKESKIVPYIKTGSGVVCTRGHVQYIVTEYGIAYLFGKSLRQRAHALINIAHPDHREALEKAAFERLKVMPGA